MSIRAIEDWYIYGDGTCTPTGLIATIQVETITLYTHRESIIKPSVERTYDKLPPKNLYKSPTKRVHSPHTRYNHR